MRLAKTYLINSICIVAASIAMHGSCLAQTQNGLVQNHLSPLENRNSQKSETNEKATSKPTADKPLVLSSRIHLQKGTNLGYLVVKVDLLKGSHIYSLTQKGNVTASKIKVAANEKFRIGGEFSPDRPANVSNDPILKQRVEKHLDSVQFFAPIEIAPGTDIAKLKVDLTFDGLVCSGSNCMPVMAKKFQGSFAGYFERTAQKQTIPQTSGNNTFR
ncbi:MAG: hypothetical protein AB8B55_16480 [Mariniblastus sp.]